ncbi:MAG: hypothetical protein EXX96DRAFT_568111 [Benjaminiella poitrasii]|nr:MAG: hypothetical protein EXX96DRAFT_568111 [Benjaminiella poitrasii]
MGAKQSKSSEPVIFYNQNSPLQGLDEPIQTKKEPVIVESNEKIEKIVQERVVKELQRMREQQEQADRHNYDELAKKNIENDHNSIAMTEDIENMIEKLKRSTSSDISSVVSERQEELIVCYKKNQSRPLDCWEEVERFKEAVVEEQKKFVATHQR